MMQFAWAFSIIILTLAMVFRPHLVFSEDISTTVSTAENQVDQAEKQLISDQFSYKDGLNDAIGSIQLTQNALNSNQNLKDVSSTLATIRWSLFRSGKTKNFTTSDFRNLKLPACAEIEMMISKLEADMINYLLTKSAVEGDTSFVVLQTDKLKLGYFINYIFFANTTSESTVSTIATLEKLVNKSQLFVSSLYSTATQIANVLYDIKVAKYGNCSKTTNNVAKKNINRTTLVKKTTISTTSFTTTTDSDENQD